jgi:hypothetical protein
MLRLLERTIVRAEDRLILLPPPSAKVPSFFQNVTRSSDEHFDLLRGLQRLRGSVYLNDGALRPEQLTSDGLHRTPEDDKSWHLIMTDGRRQVNGCIWYLEHPGVPAFEQLRVRNCPLVREEAWANKLRAAVELDTTKAQRARISYAEVGGWAVAGKAHLGDCLLLILAIYGLSQKIGGAFVLATATVRHSSAQILRRMGGAHLQGDGYEVPPYYDPNYDCQMEILRFDTRRPTPKFVHMIDTLKARFANIPVVARDSQVIETPVPEQSPAFPLRLVVQTPERRRAVA